MGDTLNEYSGGLGFSHTDVSLPGNSALPVAVGRVLATGTRQTTLGSGRFGDWDIDIPHLHTVALQNNPAWYGRAAYPSEERKHEIACSWTARLAHYDTAFG